MSTFVTVSWAEAAVLLVVLVLLVARHHRSEKSVVDEAPTIDAPPPSPLAPLFVRMRYAPRLVVRMRYAPGREPADPDPERTTP